MAFLDIKKSWDSELYISFLNHKIYIALFSKFNFFSAKLAESLLDEALLTRIYHELVQCFEVVEKVSLAASSIDSSQINKNPSKNSEDNAYDYFIDLGE